MGFFLRRFLSIAPAVLLGLLVGVLIGSLWCREFILRSAEDNLSRFVEQIRVNGRKSSEEARKVLQEVNTLSLPACSHAELEALRHLVYTSKYLKDAALVSNGAIQCSAVLGSLPQPWSGLGAGFVRPDGTRVYNDLAPYSISGESVVAVQSGNALVVYNPYNLRTFESQPMHFAVSDWDLATGRVRWLIGNLPDEGQPDQFFTRPAKARTRGVLYVTSCSQRYATCTTAYMTVPEALQSEKSQFFGYVGLSALCGALLGLVIWQMSRRNHSIEQQLRRAVRHGRIGVKYQPIFDLQSGRMVAAEALARWTDEHGVPVSPDTFIQLAEDRGFIGQITRFMVTQALRALHEISTIDPNFRVNVNIAPADINDPQFLPMLIRARTSSQVPARCLGFEITENSWADWDSARQTLMTLRQQGHLIHIDDFGKGYSSLAQLYNLPVDVLKIDKEFTQSIGTESVKTSIVPQILAMASSLNLKVVIEGIETEQQAQYYAACRPFVMAQGWYFGHPMESEDLLNLIRGPNRGLFLVQDSAPAPCES